jgi:hypothetical protein
MQGGKIRPRAWFGVALTPPVLAGDDPRQEVLLLRDVPKGHDDRRDHAQRERDLRRRIRCMIGAASRQYGPAERLEDKRAGRLRQTHFRPAIPL